MERPEQNNERLKNADVIIKNHMIWSMGAGLIPVPIADFFAVGAIQLDMVRQMCRLYDVDFKEKDGKAVVSALTGAGLSRLGANAAIKFIPGLGSVIGGVTMSVLSGASTYAIGEAFKSHFETGGTFLDLDTSRIKKMYDELFEKGKEMARKVQNEQENKSEEKEVISNPKTGINTTSTTEHFAETDIVLKRLNEVADLKEKGIITEEEFQTLKKDILARTNIG
ncbi:MAG: DUF697 domain-containing protein [Saprospirales bacterium]|nr:MAG: DUF697 domain-containing protein [Saprospirales bacterium]